MGWMVNDTLHHPRKKFTKYTLEICYIKTY